MKIKNKNGENKMMDKQSKQALFEIDLTTIEGDGAFPCPKCGMHISPEDETEENYKIVDTRVVNDELVELVVTCGKCGSTIRLTGFQQFVG